MKPIAIFGVGPAGLMAAHAVGLAGRPVALFSMPGEGGAITKSKLGGAQFLHDPLPGINDEDEPDANIIYECYGTVDGYRKKVYGDDPTIPFVSMEKVTHGKTQPAWNLQRTYDALWELLSAERANGVSINPMWIEEVIDKEWFDAIISTVPAPSICRAHAGLLGEHHLFVSQEISIANECIWEGIPDNRIVYNGDPEYSWYRCSRLFGQGSTEWSNIEPMTSELVRVRKPIRTTCDCYEGIITRVGRYGAWTKGLLTHHAFVETMKMFM